MRITTCFAAALGVFLFALPVLAQTPPQKEIDKAIDKGCEFLMKRVDKYCTAYDYSEGKQTDAVLVLYTLIKGRADQKRPEFQKALSYCMSFPLDKTYFCAVLAIALEAIDAEKYYSKIGQCAQFLVDNQCMNGQWGYGHQIPISGFTKGPRVRIRGGKKTYAKMRIVKTKTGGKDGDNSNTQYALLGLRSCEAAGFEIPSATWGRALDWWKKTQQKDGGWSYGNKHAPKEGSYLGMAEGGMGSCVIALHYLGRDWRKDDSVEKARQYIAKKFSLDQNFVPRENSVSWQYYHLYALERAGNLSFTEKFGEHDWYAEGAKFLLEKQAEDGRWDGQWGFKKTSWDTCFAVLFLARATRPVASGVAGEGKKEEEEKE